MSARRHALSLQLGVAASLLLLAGACERASAPARVAVPPAAPARTTSITEALTVSEGPGSGLVRVHGSGGECAGQMLTRTWVLTAAHCLCASDANTDSTKTSTTVFVTLGSDSAKATLVQLHPTQDAALLRLEHMLPLGASIALWSDTSAALVHKEVECQGFDRVLVADGGVAAYGRLRVQSAGTALASVTAQCNGGGASSQIDGFSVVPPGADEDAGAAFDAFEGGGPCFVERHGVQYLAGIVGTASNTDPKTGMVVGIDGLESWIHTTTDIWSDAECTADVPGSKFAIDPMIFVGTPDSSTMSLVARHAYGVAGDQKTIVRQTTGVHFSWTSLPIPPITDDMLAIGASVDPQVPTFTGKGTLMSLWYVDGHHQQRAYYWYDPSVGVWIGPGYAANPVSGTLVSALTVRVGMDYSVLLPLWITDQGKVGSTMFIGTTNLTMTKVNSLIDFPLPSDAPVGDASRRPTVISNPVTSNVYAGYRSLAGQFITYLGAGYCFANSDSRQPWCPGAPPADGQPTPLGQVTVHDLPMMDVRDVGLGVTTVPSETYWAVAVGNDDQMRLWLLGTDGKSRDYGPIGDHALGMVKTVPYVTSTLGQSLFVSYTADSWSARVRPVGNCLGNTPPGW
jgi:hypothetical protein